ncbi:hypothetical protein OKW21_003803 [Catalinimonas alkaloidigena]|nr:hypothetical protein [Catalinimonas alkaloidigena]
MQTSGFRVLWYVKDDTDGLPASEALHLELLLIVKATSVG